MNFGHLNVYGLAWLWQLVSFALVVYFVLRFLQAIERGSRRTSVSRMSSRD